VHEPLPPSQERQVTRCSDPQASAAAGFRLVPLPVHLRLRSCTRGAALAQDRPPSPGVAPPASARRIQAQPGPDLPQARRAAAAIGQARLAGELCLSLDLTAQPTLLLEQTRSMPWATRPEGANLGRRRSRDLRLAVEARRPSFQPRRPDNICGLSRRFALIVRQWARIPRQSPANISAGPDCLQTSSRRAALRPAPLRLQQLSPHPVVSPVDNRLGRPTPPPEIAS